MKHGIYLVAGVNACILAAQTAFAASVEVSYPFQGVERYHIQTSVPRLVDINLLKIDPTAAGIDFYVSPSNGALPGETTTQTTRSFVAQYGMQIGINADFYSFDPSAPYTNLAGLAVSEGNAYSQFYANYPALNITADNQLSIVTAVPENQSFVPPFNSGYVPSPSVRLYNAVAGNDYIVTNGVNTATWADGLNPRTAAGISTDGKLLLMTVDGRNNGHSLGLTTSEVADVMIGYGAKFALNLDGGGSSTMVFADPTPRVINIPVGVNNVPGSERSVGNNLGLRALSYSQPQATKYIYADFERNDLGAFSSPLAASGSTQGINAPASANIAMTGIAHNSTWSQRLIIADDPAVNSPTENPVGGWFVREVADASLTRNVVRASDGYVGFWAVTTTPGIATSLAIDNASDTLLGRSRRTSLIADGRWHLYEWNLDDSSQWEAWLQGGGVIDPRGFMVDSLLFFGPATNAVINIDDISHNAGGSLSEVPEPTASALGLILGASLLCMRFLSINRSRATACALAALLSAALPVGASAAELPAVSNRQPVPTPHFPDRLHAVVWRNWGLVTPERIADVLGTERAKVVEIATSMGLPQSAPVPPEMEERGYITILRRNWHLLPYDQLLKLLKISADELAFRLREDDFLYEKLGSLKPQCTVVSYHEPNETARQRAAEIRDVVHRHFADEFARPADPRFSFVTAFDRASPQSAAPKSDRDGLRFIYSYFAMFGDPLLNPQLDPYPDGLLQQLQANGVNGVWLHTVLRQLAPGGDEFPEFGQGHEDRMANLRKLVARAKRFGIDAYLYVNEPRAMPGEFFADRPEMAGVREGAYTAMCTSDPRVRRWIADSLAYVFKEVPDLGGVFAITASENLTSCASHHHREPCPRCSKRTDPEIIAEVVRSIEEGVHRSAPKAKVIAYDWAWNQNQDASNTIALLPSSVYVMSVSEWSVPINRGGVPLLVSEYSMSAIGPGPRAAKHWNAAKQHGLKTIAKVQFNNSWELASVPYLPVLNLVGEHCEHLAKANIDGMMLSWSLGGYPSPNLELAHEISDHKESNVQTLIHALAERHYGPKASARVCSAWAKFSSAFKEYPYSGEVLYFAPQQMGPANLLYEKPTGYAASMVGIPYDDLNRWRGLYPVETFASQFQKVAEGWADGLSDLRAAIADVPPEKQLEAAADLRVAAAAQLHFASVVNQASYILARDELPAAAPARRTVLQNSIRDIIDREIKLAHDLFELSVADSRLGYEASNHYFYVPFDLVEKVVACEYLKTRFDAERSKQGK